MLWILLAAHIDYGLGDRIDCTNDLRIGLKTPLRTYHGNQLSGDIYVGLL